MIFGRRKKKDKASEPATISERLAQEESGDHGDAAAEAAEPAEAGQSREPAPQEASAEAGGTGDGAESRGAEKRPARPEVSGAGPYDVSEVDTATGYLDFGAVKVPTGPEQKVRLDVDQRTRRVIALTISVGQASIQIQPFSAPKSGGTWEEVREQIRASITAQKGRAREVRGNFGTEVVARVPTTLKDGRSGWRVARFIGAEGSRWFLRGVVGGRGAIDPQAAQAVEDLFSRLVVERGGEPLPPRELLALRQPEGAKRVVRRRPPRSRRTERTGTAPQVDPAQEPAQQPDTGGATPEAGAADGAADHAERRNA